MVMDKAKLISLCGNVPVLGPSLRRIARRYPEGSVTTIRNGSLAGYRWKRSHRYVSGYWLGIYELPIQECLLRELKPGDVFYDIGANAGFFSLLASKCVGPTGNVFAFEPLPENIRFIQVQLELNAVENCTVVGSAVSDCETTVEFSSGKDTSTAHIQDQRDGEGETALFSVRATSLNEFAKEARPPDFIKLDVEGAEVSALRGATRLFSAEKPPRLLIEFHSEQLKEVGCSLLMRFGYHFRSTMGHPLDPVLAERHVLCLPTSYRNERDRPNF